MLRLLKPGFHVALLLALTAACKTAMPASSPENAGLPTSSINATPPATDVMSHPQSQNGTPPGNPAYAQNATTPPADVQGPFDIWIVGHEYQPSILKFVPVGTTVTWVSKDSEFHTVTSDIGLFDAGLSYKQTFGFTFTKAGTYNIICSLHPDMTGVVTVR